MNGEISKQECDLKHDFLEKELSKIHEDIGEIRRVLERQIKIWMVIAGLVFGGFATVAIAAVMN